MLIGHLILLFFSLAGLASGPLLFWRLRTPAGGSGGEGSDAPPRLSVIIPARNEEHNLPILLESLGCAGLTRRGGETEILVVDDESSDATREIAASYGCRVVVAGARPNDWVGKSWACWRGALAATKETLLFLDADTAFEPDGLLTLNELFSRNGGLVSVQPYHRTPTVVERLSALFNWAQFPSITSTVSRWRRTGPSSPIGSPLPRD